MCPTPLHTQLISTPLKIIKPNESKKKQYAG
jgi:hypothetical protein